MKTRTKLACVAAWSAATLLAACGDGGEAPAAGAAAPSTPAVDTTAPTTPTGLAIQNLTSSGLTLQWAASTDNIGVSGYDIYLDCSFVGSVSGTTPLYRSTTLSPSSVYELRVRSRDSAGNLSALSAPLSVTTPAAAGAPTAGWTLRADFEGGTLGQKAEATNGFHNAAGGSTYTTDHVLGGSTAARISIAQGQTGYGMWGGAFNFPTSLYKGDTVWFLVHTYMPSGFDHYSYGEGTRLKFLRIHTLNEQGSNTGYNDLYFDTKGEPNPFKTIYEGGGAWTDLGGASDAPVFDKWESYEISVTLDTVPVAQGGKAETKIWKNGVLLGHVRDKRTLAAEGGYSNRALLFTYWNGGAPKTQHMYVDEIVITNTRPGHVDAQGNHYLRGLIHPRTTCPPGP